MEWSINKTDCNSKRNPDDRETNKDRLVNNNNFTKIKSEVTI